MKHIVLTSMPRSDLAARWNTFILDVPYATHYVTPNYFTDPYVRGERFAVLAIEDNGQIAAVMTGIVDGKRIVSGLFSRPQVVFSENADRETAGRALIDGLKEIRSEPRSIEIHTWQEIRDLTNHNMHESLSNYETSVVMIDLSIGTEAIFTNFSQTRRSEIRKAIKQGTLEIKEVETATELAELYKISSDWNARKHTVAGSFSQMQAAALQRENRRIFIAKAEGKVIAGSFFRFAPGGVVEYAANYSRPEYQKLRPNDLIGWHAIQWACRNGLSHFSMGGSHLFLRRFGGEILTTYRYKWSDEKFRLSVLKEKTRELSIDAYRRLPERMRIGMRKVFAG